MTISASGRVAGVARATRSVAQQSTVRELRVEHARSASVSRIAMRADRRPRGVNAGHAGYRHDHQRRGSQPRERHLKRRGSVP